MKNNKTHSQGRPFGRFQSSSSDKKGKGKRSFSPFNKEEKESLPQKQKFGGKPAFKSKRDFERKPRPEFDGEAGFERKARPEFKGKSDFERKPRPEFKGKAGFERRPRPEFKPRRDVQTESYKPQGDNVLIWGLHAARAAFLNPKRRVHRVWLTEAGQKLFEATQNSARDDLLKRPDAKKVEREEMDRIVPPASVHQGIVIEASPLPEISLHDVIAADPPPDLILMLDQVTDPHNVGAILRSAAAFGAGAVVMTERNAPTTTGVLAKSASGALEHTPMVHVVNLARALDELREAGYWSVGLAEEGEKSLSDLDLSGRTVLVLGAEGEGLRHLTRQKCDELARLPTQGPIGSLNVSNAAAVALYEVRRVRK